MDSTSVCCPAEWRSLHLKMAEAQAKPVPHLLAFNREIANDRKDFQQALNAFLTRVGAEVL
ncbi:hypothetical protein [Streptomyces sp. NPDC058671]|uniref:hypothetical protein n=1 Tax=Streptomyces sp. NPDC058671 TaxID=3346590 RepID=UPI00365E412B